MSASTFLPSALQPPPAPPTEPPPAPPMTSPAPGPARAPAPRGALHDGKAASRHGCSTPVSLFAAMMATSAGRCDRRWSASQFKSEIKVAREGVEVNGKSIMGIMMLAAAKGTEISLTVTGEDEIDAFQKLGELITNGFGED